MLSNTPSTTEWLTNLTTNIPPETDHAKSNQEISTFQNSPMSHKETVIHYPVLSKTNQSQSPLMPNHGNSIQVESSPTVENH